MAKLLREEMARKCRESLVAWCIEALAPFQQVPARHHVALIRELEAVERGETDRLMVTMPPRHAKSFYVSRLFPAYFLCRRPRTSIIAASHTYSLAEDFGRFSRNLVDQHRDTLGYWLRPDSKAAGRWNTSRHGSYLAAGVGKAIAGRPADLLIIDDPVPNREAAESETQREHTWNWYRSDAYTRLQPKGRIILVMTRWHEDDLGGRLLRDMEAGGDQWKIVNFPALALENDPMGRAPGEALWPEWFTREDLLRIRATIGERDFAALYQQSPRPPEGALFKVGMLAVQDAVPPLQATVRAWDFAATRKMGTSDPDWTVGLKLGRTVSGGYVVIDIVRFRGSPDEVLASLVNTAKYDGPRVKIRIPEEPGQAGKMQALAFTQALAGYSVVAERETGDKANRADPVAAQVNIGGFSMQRAPWNMAFREELASFPNGSHDDQVDALSGAFSVVGLQSRPMKISDMAFNHLARNGNGHGRSPI